MATILLKKPNFYRPSKPNESNASIAATEFRPPKISLKSVCLAEDIRRGLPNGGGVFELTDLGTKIKPPFEVIEDIFKKVENEPELARRANDAYTNNLVYKDAYGNGNGGALVDEKKVIDLSPQRLDTIAKVDADLVKEFGPSLEEALEFFNAARLEVAPRVLSALAEVAGDPTIANDGMVNYR